MNENASSIAAPSAMNTVRSASAPTIPSINRRACRAAGVPIAVGSDAHRPEDVTDGVAAAYAHAWDAGYRTMEVPRADGGWDSVPLR